jgi:hypothetical protein
MGNHEMTGPWPTLESNNNSWPEALSECQETSVSGVDFWAETQIRKLPLTQRINGD